METFQGHTCHHIYTHTHTHTHTHTYIYIYICSNNFRSVKSHLSPALHPGRSGFCDSLTLGNKVLGSFETPITGCTGLFKMIVGVLTTCHTQYTWDRSICVFFLFNRTTLQVFVTYLTGALYVHPLWFYRHHHDNRVRSACQRWWLQWRFWFVPSVPGYTRTQSLETVRTTFEWNCQMVAVSRILCGIAVGQLYLDRHFWITLYLPVDTA